MPHRPIARRPIRVAACPDCPQHPGRVKVHLPDYVLQVLHDDGSATVLVRSELLTPAGALSTPALRRLYHGNPAWDRDDLVLPEVVP